MPELPVHGILTDKNVTHEQITNAVIEYIEKKDLKHIIILGHSFSGTVVATVAQQIPDRIDRIVFSNAFVPLDGQSLYDQLPPGPFAWHTNQSSHLGFYRYIQGDGDHFTTFQNEPKMIAQKFVEAGRP